MFEIRNDEPEYAFLSDKDSATLNRYGFNIDTVAADDELRNTSLNINCDAAISDNPNRYKQHGFFFTADNCIGCHACEAACSEKNDNPGHIAFRSVGFVEGGTYPDYSRLNISMACNHCDDPVCLKGCPTRAYTKFAEYGAVLQDPDICFGCGYCTWVCPYNAPQLDPVKGQVSKCNMCVDRLEVGLKPACVTACLGNALDFGVIENKPENRTQAKAELPGFPSTEITRPNIRFQQTKNLQRDMVRVDSVPIKYHRDDEGTYHSEVNSQGPVEKHWGLSKLFHSHENAHAIFTLSAQTVMGAFLMLVLGSWFSSPAIAAITASSAQLPLLAVMVALMGFGLFKLNMHLGKPHRFYRGYNNLRHSPVSREIAGVTLFFIGLCGYAFFAVLGVGSIKTLFAIIGLVGFIAGSWYMYKLYRIPARPFWNHWQTGTAFYGTMLSLGALLVAIIGTVATGFNQTLIPVLSLIAAAGLTVEIIGHYFHRQYLIHGPGEAGASYYIQNSDYGKTWWLRNILLGINLVALLIISQSPLSGIGGAMIGLTLTISILTSAYLGRILFYMVVIPTTMPGAFFWKNQKFVDHARDSGLADMQQLGVAYERHHKFKFGELISTIKENDFRSIWAHTKNILTGK